MPLPNHPALLPCNHVVTTPVKTEEQHSERPNISNLPFSMGASPCVINHTTSESCIPVFTFPQPAYSNLVMPSMFSNKFNQNNIAPNHRLRCENKNNISSNGHENRPINSKDQMISLQKQRHIVDTKEAVSHDVLKCDGSYSVPTKFSDNKFTGFNETKVDKQEKVYAQKQRHTTIKNDDKKNFFRNTHNSVQSSSHSTNQDICFRYGPTSSQMVRFYVNKKKLVTPKFADVL